MALKRRIKKLSKSEIRKVVGRQYLVCSECGAEEVEVPQEIVRVTCAYCVQKMIAPPSGYKTEKSDKPRGWHFKSYFEQNGVVYSRGVVVTDPVEIKRLRNGGTGEPVIKKTNKTVAKKAVRKLKTVKKTPKKVSVRGKKNARSTK
jgi:DNA-directed RNA polymerase subunit RPC12/RpoP